ncbi:MAG: hypothetical protein FWD69_11265 [Polyangiaceae bacterium]|nr:hypothetical protein [Polyangiaceae bacterium]
MVCARRIPLAFALASTFASVGACVLVEPPDDLPATPPTRPTILHASAVPSTSAVLSVFPSKFIVPVEITPATASFAWAAFVDYNPHSGEGLVGVTHTSEFDPTTTQDGVRLLEVSINPPDTGGCHVIEVVVALHLSDTDPHSPASPGGDIVQWFYSPSGDMRGCSVADAGIDASFIDAGGGSP